MRKTPDWHHSRLRPDPQPDAARILPAPEPVKLSEFERSWLEFRSTFTIPGDAMDDLNQRKRLYGND